MKKILALLLALVMVFALVSCAASDKPDTDTPDTDTPDTDTPDTDTPDTDTPDADGDKWKVVFLAGDMADESLVYQSECLERHADKYNMEYTVMDAQADPQKQVQQMANCIAQDVDAIIMNPNDSSAIGPTAMEAHEAGILVCTMSADIAEEYAEYRDCYSGPNDEDSGVKGAEQLMEALPNGGKVVEIGGQASHIAQQLRHAGFTSTIEGSNIEVLDYQACQEWNTAQAMAIMEDFITKYGDQIEGVYCHWDNGASGVIEAIKNADMDMIPIVAVDGCQAGYDQVANGTQYASIATSYDIMGENLMKFVSDALNGNDTSYLEDGWWYKMEWQVYNADTYQDYDRPTW